MNNFRINIKGKVKKDNEISYEAKLKGDLESILSTLRDVLIHNAIKYEIPKKEILSDIKEAYEREMIK